MSTGADHYRHAEELLDAAGMAERGSPAEASYFAEAQVNASLAQAAATALTATVKAVGESIEINDWAELILPAALVVDADIFPSDWPPTRGQVWVDRDGRHWLCVKDDYLINLGSSGDDTADAVWRKHGPLCYRHTVGTLDDKASC